MTAAALLDRPSAATSSALRLPAFGREVALLLRAGRRPIGNTIIVTTNWNFSTAFVRVVCPTDVPATAFDFSFLRGQQTIVLVPLRDLNAGRLLLACVRRAFPIRALLCVCCDDPWQEAA
jgi:hypothetical protein